MGINSKSVVLTMVKTIAFCTVCLIALCQCSSKSVGIRKSDVIKVELTYKLPALYTDDSAFVAVDSTCIYYYQQYIVYELPSRHQEYVENVLISDTPTVYYVGYDTIKRKAFKTQSLVDSPLVWIKLDSFLTKRPEAFDINKVLQTSTLDTSIAISKNQKVLYYRVKDESIDSLLLYFDNASRDAPFSYARDIDAAHNSKLVRIQFNLKKDTLRHIKHYNEYRIVSWELRKTSLNLASQKIIALCRRIGAS